MAGKRRTGRRVKIHRSYTVDEVASLLSVAKGTVRRWLKTDLYCLDDQRPTLILGQDLKTFLDGRRKSKQICRPEECFCMSCKAPRNAAFGEVEYNPMTASGGNLRALCNVCSTVMHKRISAGGLEVLRSILTVTVPQVETPISKRTPTCTNDHLKRS
ncbi:hypothetical protein LP7551_03935 [Roseibium album]|nr:hypothetical protein LP7551_03935 [Roseibium album]